MTWSKWSSKVKFHLPGGNYSEGHNKGEYEMMENGADEQDRVREIFCAVLGRGRRHLTELESKDVLIAGGIPVVPTRLAASPDEAVIMAEGMGFPVVMKISSPQIVHKSDAGGVKTGIRDRNGVRSAYEEIVNNARRYDPDAHIDGIVVQAMQERGLELIVGGIRDPVFGAVVMFGLGGTWVEVLKDVEFALAPPEPARVRELMESIRGAPILKGFRGGRPVDQDALIDIVVKVGTLLHTHPEIGEIDINPVFARLDGAVAVDARIVLVDGVTRQDLDSIPEEPESLQNMEPGTGPGRSGPAMTPGKANLLSLFDPEYVVVVGSSSIVEDTGMTTPLLFDNISGNIRRFGGGHVILDIDRTAGHEPSVEALSDVMTEDDKAAVRARLSCAVIVLPPEESITWAKVMMELGISGIIQITGGFTAEQRDRYKTASTAAGTRVLGPNTIMGVINTASGFGETASSAVGSIPKSSSFTSTNSGIAPTRATALAVATNP